MAETIYKVILKDNNNVDERKSDLIFKSISSKRKIKLSSNLILTLKKLTTMNQKYILFQNISQVLKIDKESSLLSYNYYYIILYTLRNGKREGFLIGNEKSTGDILIGIWPFNTPSSEILTDQIIDKINNLIENPDKYDEVLVIS